jgi:hypothetical protein
MSYSKIKWAVIFHEKFSLEFDELALEVQDELLSQMVFLEEFGPQLGRPRVDTLKGSSYSNMKELRFQAANGVWRVAFAYDPKRQAILLVSGNKAGVSEKRFYRELIRKADDRFSDYLQSLNED